MLKSNYDSCPDRWVCTGASCSEDLSCPTSEFSEVAYNIRLAGTGQQSEHLSLMLFGCKEPLDARKELAAEQILNLKRAEKYNDQWTRTTRFLTWLRVRGASYIWMPKQQQLPRQVPPSDTKLHCIKQPFTLTSDKVLPQPRTPLEAWKSIMGKSKNADL